MGKLRLIVQRLVWGSFGLIPLALCVKLLDVSPLLQFSLGALALLPIAWLIGEATDQAAGHVGPTFGGLMNATFGNTVELFIVFFAISDGLFEVVRGSLVGSVVSNLLLILGLALVVGGSKELDRQRHSGRALLG